MKLSNADEIINQFIMQYSQRLKIGNPRNIEAIKQAKAQLHQALIAKMPHKKNPTPAWREWNRARAKGYNFALDEVTKIINNFFTSEPEGEQ